MKTYDILANAYEHLIDDVLYAIYVKTIQKHTQPCIALEVGSGTAALSRELARLNYQMHAMDTSDMMLAVGSCYSYQERLDVSFYHGSMLDPFPLKADLILLPTDVINHLHTEDELITLKTHLLYALHEGGTLIFDTLNPLYAKNIVGHSETVKIHDDTLLWEVKQGSTPERIKHEITLNDMFDSHEETVFPLETYENLFKELNLIEKLTLEERTLYVYKKEK